VRSLFEEIAQLLGGVGHLKILERIAIGSSLSSEALKEESWPLKGEEFNLSKWAMPLDKVLALNEVHLTADQTKKYLQGQRFLLSLVEIKNHPKRALSSDLMWVYSHEGMLLGLARIATKEDENLAELQAIFNLPLSISHYLNS
jgi:tRNA pseudouridine55 synthase